MKKSPFSKAQAARDLIQAANGEEVSATKIEAQVPGLSAKNVPATLESSVRRGEVGVRSNSMGVKFYFWQAARNASQADNPAMTSTLKPLNRLGPGACGVPFREPTVQPASIHSGPTREIPMTDKTAVSPASADEISKGIADVQKQLDAAKAAGHVKTEPPGVDHVRDSAGIHITGDLKAPDDRTNFWISDQFNLQIEQGAQAVTLSLPEVERMLAFVSRFHTV